MLQTIRSRAAGIIAKVLFAFLALVFAMWGIGDYVGILRTRIPPAIAVGNTTLSPDFVQSEIDRQTAQMRRSLGQVDPAILAQLNISDSVIDRLVREAAIENLLRDMGMSVSRAMVIARIQSAQEFRVGGRFDPNQMRNILAQVNMTEAQLISEIQRDRLRAALVDGVERGARVPDAVVERLYRHSQERRRGEYIFVAAADMPDPGEPEAAAIQTTYDDHTDDFTLPEFRAATLLRLDVEQIAASRTVTEEELRDEFQNRQQEFRQPERRTLQPIRFADEAAARAARERLVAGTSYEDIARDAQTDLAALSLARVTRTDVPTEFGLAFDLELNAVSEPIRTPLGWFLLRVSEITPAQEPDFAAVRSQLEDELKRRRAAEEIYEIANRIEDAVASGRTLEEAAQAAGLTPVTIAAMNAEGRDPAGEFVPALTAAPDVARQIFSTPQGQLTQLIETGTALYLARVDGITPQRQQPLEEVRARVIDLWKADRRREAARARAEQLMAQITAGQTLAAVAEAAHLDVRPIEPVLRPPASSGETPREAVDRLFALAPDTTGLASGTDGNWLVHLTEILPADAAAGTEALETLRAQLARRIAEDALTDMTEALRQRYGVTVDRTYLRTTTN